MSRATGPSGGWWRRGAGAALCGLATLLALAAGCSSVRTIPIEDVSTEGRGGTRVVMRDGFVYRFDRVAVRGDSLYGSYQVTEERQGRDGAIVFEDVMRQTIVPVGDVARLEAKHWDLSKSLLLGAGGVLFTIYLTDVLGEDEKEVVDHGNQKP